MIQYCDNSLDWTLLSAQQKLDFVQTLQARRAQNTLDYAQSKIKTRVVTRKLTRDTDPSEKSLLRLLSKENQEKLLSLLTNGVTK